MVRSDVRLAAAGGHHQRTSSDQRAHEAPP
jgi:hypothetical protein